MRNAVISVIVLCLLSIVAGFAQERKDTLWTTEKDRLIISYRVERQESGVTIHFSDVQKRLSPGHSRKYKKLDEVVVLFFDRTGSYQDMRFLDMVPEAFMVPSGLRYAPSEQGYFFLQDHPLLSFDVLTAEEATVSVPVYLAHYEGKRKYELFGVCRGLDIKVNTGQASASAQKLKSIMQTITSEEESDADNEETMEALSSIKIVAMLLEAQTSYPYSEDLQYEIARLKLMHEKTDNKELDRKIKETLVACDIKRKELEQVSLLARQEAERQAMQTAQQERVRQDSIQTAEQQRQTEEKKQNQWLILGVVGLAVVGFIGNQVFQHFRNIRNQKNMMEMQQSIARQAENEAKRRAREVVRNKTHQAANKAVSQGKKAVNTKIRQIRKDKKSGNISI